MSEKMYGLLEKLYLEVQSMQTEMKDIKETMATKEDLKDFATKEDLKDFATKEDLKDFATKEDLKDFATKEDLKDFATKDDLKNLATKDDINILADELHTEIQSVHDELVELRSDLSTMEVLTTKNAYDIAKLKAIR
ncbi:MAG TPA: hypothetical protein VK071_07820 [Tissierellales bacterium]|nr:hypothetical protein [Tissierellales bacterium]